ncbi:MAG TPA: hypothetical protein VL358_02490 [Caulobacteraceae bacterium]|jgi:hypothetical protein|nr:hypothetical protein [Caulobacteraceae bacterium]
MHIPRILALGAAAAVASATLGAAAGEPPKAPSPDPRNFEGVWSISHPARVRADKSMYYGAQEPDAITHGRVLWPLDQKEPPFTAWGRAKFDAAFEANVNNRPLADMPSYCLPHGVPRIMINPYPMQVVQSPGLILMLFEVNHNVRLIHMNQRPPAHPKSTLMGYSIGHWEGDTLVVQTNGLSGESIFDELGTPHSDALKLTERIRKIDGGRGLEDTFTIDDPIAFTRPWQTREVLAWKDGAPLMEYICEENNRNLPDAEGKTTANSGKTAVK